MHGRLFRLTKDYGAIREDFKGYDKGKIVKAVMVSRMGDVGVTLNLSATYGYDLRVMPWMLEPVEPRPAGICDLCNLQLESGEHGYPDRKCDTCGGETGPCDPTCPTCCFNRAKVTE
jgi:hypothetical protein